MADRVFVSFEGRKVSFIREDISLYDLENIFLIERSGAHLKMRREDGNSFENLYPNCDGNFQIPHNCAAKGDILLVAMKKDSASPTPAPTTSQPTNFNKPSIFNQFFGRRGNSSAVNFASTSGVQGPRPAPNVWSNTARGKKRKFQEIKSFRLTYANVEAGVQLQDMWEIPIDLASLHARNNCYTVFDVISELERQMDEGTKLIITDIKGNPIRDMTITRVLSQEYHSILDSQKSKVHVSTLLDSPSSCHTHVNI
ncbi:hypothetical protein AC249_AIPGENE26764 [Exaiptasia diaphana]|nr:hypothetical protein AC249_AIPGENE26764 [Exaiptasia diaphana]